ncbi:DNA alkylation repair protein [Clostridium botulinum]|uniref:DNA alkylation repair protein n=1 Tax=Clostridium botulinum TaxID=1491 RepID=UPI0013F0D263|nr:DNA alkylation repair protein [Clostridium botulinum]MBY6915709.1 DNA alkylation repair protein [Clostridium botulinum]NFH89622.1 DNA alkylation repair protein [Clostridium botulinum]NFI18634.1 DNA alkylation repair protein [Clostridium botulinum]NFI53381.1 DNA alkylation repair protein [Clostridium botulinum]NFL91539.1 DNA alkylation repair protein [Clostridium botulinum]
MNNQYIKEKIFELSDSKYKEFHSKLCPNTNNIVGVRVPILRNLAKEIAKGNWIDYLSQPENEYYEEIMLQGMVIGLAKMDIDERIKYIEEFVPKIYNWGICDTFCAGLKCFKSNKEKGFELLNRYLDSQKEFELRFAIVLLLDFYIVDEYIDRVIEILDNIHHDGYYVKMAVAWAISICYIKYPEKTMTYLKDNKLDDFTYNKALQKITESYRVDKDEKIIIRNMKRR